MPGTLEVLKSILEQIPPGFTSPWIPLRPIKDRILRELSVEEIRDHEEVCELESELRASLRRSLRYIQLFESKRFLLLDKVRMSDERADSAEARGKVLGFRKTVDGDRVLVESEIEEME